jgi:hypothetical protein
MLEENQPYSEPPFEVFSKLKDRAWVAQQNQYYWSNKVTIGITKLHDIAFYSILLVEPSGGWRSEGKVRVVLSTGKKVAVNLVWNELHNLTSTGNTSIPFESEYPDRFASESLAWELPATLLKPGAANSVHIVPKSGASLPYFTVLHVDVLLPV